MKQRDTLAVFNRGRISRLAVARTDVARVALSASIQTNWQPRTLGPMSLRAGMGYKGDTRDGALIPFVFSNAETALLELSAGVLRIWDGGDTLLSKPAVTAAVSNPDFTSDLSLWDDADDAGAVSSWDNGDMVLTGTKYNSARRRQQVFVDPVEQGIVHTLKINVALGPVVLRIGTNAGEDNVFRQSVLRTGEHFISFVPNGFFHIEFASPRQYGARVSVCDLFSGDIEIQTSWASTDDCKLVRWDQSSDVVFCACEGYRQQRIERRPNNSWSVVDYEADDGPFLTENFENITITPSAIQGNITLTASRDVFDSGKVGALFSLTSQGQLVEADLSAELTFTNEIRVAGVSSDGNFNNPTESGRQFTITRSGTWVGTVSLQRSLGVTGAWATVRTFTGNGSFTYDDELDNVVAFYRLGFEAGDFTSGVAELSMEYAGGSITGIAKVTGFTSSTLVDAIVLSDLGGTSATEIWAEGAWSDREGWPTAVVINEGRLVWFANGRTYASVSDSFSSFDPDVVGDAGPINRRIGRGAINRTNWALPLQRMLVGVEDAEHSIRSNSFDEPLTNSNYNSKIISAAGTAPSPAAMLGTMGYFIDQTTRRIYEADFDGQRGDLTARDMTLLVPEIGDEGFARIAAQKSPDMRLHAVRDDGTVGVLVRDAAEDVLCWVDYETDGLVEDVAVLPGARGDRVFYRVKRTIGGVDQQYLEEMARLDECVGDAVSKLADSFIVGSGAITGLDHLEGETVVIWGDGVDQGTAIVSGGAVSQTYTDWVVGLGYTARYKSAKLAGQTALGMSLTQRSRIDHLGLLLADTHAQGLQFGPSFELMDDMPAFEDGAQVDADAIWDEYEEDMIEFPGDWSTDNRICLQAAAPRPCTVLALVASNDRQDKA